MHKSIFLTLVCSIILSSCETSAPDHDVQITDPDNSVIIVKDVCGDGILTSKEVCDLTLFNSSKDCRNYGFDSGEVQCSSTCTLDFSKCEKNNPVKEDPNKEDPNKEDPNKEDPNKEDPNKEDPNKEDPNKEDPNKEDPNLCGNGTVDDGEDCDTDSPLGLCSKYDRHYVDGYVYCTDSCGFDFTQCERVPICGDDVREGADEQCDTSEPVGDCVNFGDYDLGKVWCSDECKLDYSECEKLPICGNKIKEKGEDCDDGNKIDTDGCTNNCTTPSCGDGILSDTEICEGNQIPYSTCAEYNPNFDLGTISCNSDCTLNTSKCAVSPRCGDGSINSPNEQCENGLAISASCTDIYELATGDVSCNNCKIDYSNCQEYCPTNREFLDGKYSLINSTDYIRKVTSSDGIVYIVYTKDGKNKVGNVKEGNIIRWISSTEGDEGFYSKFDVTCGCVSCDITLGSNSYFVKQDALNDTHVNTKNYSFEELDNNTIPKTKPPVLNILPAVFKIDYLNRDDTTYGSCNNQNRKVGSTIVQGCEDSDYFYFKKARNVHEMASISTEECSWDFYVVQELGDDLYLMYYKSGNGCFPAELKQEGVTNPYAIVRVTRTEPYVVCDATIADIKFEFQSWSGYKDIALNYPEYTSDISLTYKPRIRYSDVNCGEPNTFPNFTMIFTESDGNPVETNTLFGRDVYSGASITRNICDDFVTLVSDTKVGYEREITPSFSTDGFWYKSLYRNRPNVIVHNVKSYTQCTDSQFPTRAFKCNQREVLDIKRVEIEFSNFKDVLAIINCDRPMTETQDGYPDYITDINYNNRCKFTDLYPDNILHSYMKGGVRYYSLQEMYEGYYRYKRFWTNHFKSETIKYCLVKNDESRECVDVVPYNNSKDLTNSSIRPYFFTCTPRYH